VSNLLKNLSELGRQVTPKLYNVHVMFGVVFITRSVKFCLYIHHAPIKLIRLHAFNIQITDDEWTYTRE